MLKSVKAYALAALLTLALVSFFAPRATAQLNGVIQGTVLNFEGKPYADLPVDLKGEQGTVKQTKTDAAGKFIFPNLRSGKYTLAFHPSEMQQPFEVQASAQSSGPTDVPINFKEIIEKSPEGAAALKKREEEQQKTAGMKDHFNNGIAFLDQERAAKTDLAKATPDQRDQAKQKINDLADKAVAEFQQANTIAPEKDPNHHLFWARMGEAYDLAGRTDDAINAYQQAVTLKPDNASYYNNLGNVLAKAGKIDDARVAYTKSAELDPPNAGFAWRNFGISLYQSNRMQEGVEPLKKAVEIDPKNAQSWYLLGACLVASADYKQVGDKVEVTLKPGTIEAYQKALELDPNGTWGKQAKDGLEQVNQLTGGIDTKVGGKKKKP
ncbi:MAG TPA: tetratricopeptide repeat protein [Candidatus Dormibacteraeota bacterium]|nr:tetratricopeptide repeat protein [Candidatus Dormibacteraeota bacterium]